MVYRDFQTFYDHLLLLKYFLLIVYSRTYTYRLIEKTQREREKKKRKKEEEEKHDPRLGVFSSVYDEKHINKLHLQCCSRIVIKKRESINL